MKVSLILFAVLTLALLSGSGSAIAAGATYYVSPTGSDANPGTLALPWQHIQKAANSLQAGDTVLIRAGTYNEQVKPQNSGNATAGYITYAAYPNETVTIDGNGLTLGAADGLVWLRGKSYIRISGLRVVNARGGMDTTGIRLDYASFAVVRNNYIYNTQSSGIGVWGGHDIHINGNEIELANNGGGEENLSIAASAYNVEISGNYVHGGFNSPYGGEGINLKDGVHDVKVHHNRVTNPNKLCFGIDAWTHYTYNLEVFDNLANGCMTGFIASSEQGGLLENVRIYNNIAANSRMAGLAIPWWGGTKDGLKRNIQFVNNTSYHNGYGLWVNSPQNENVLVRNNILFGNTADVSIVAGASGQIALDHNLTANPLFANPAGGDFHLLAGSPAIDAGSSTNAPSDDYDGKARPQGVGFDVGAYEAAGVVGATPTATAQPTDTPTSTATPTATMTPVSPTATPLSPTVTATPTSTPTPVYICTSTLQAIPNGYRITTDCVLDDSKG